MCHCSVAGAHTGFCQVCNGIWMSVRARASRPPNLFTGTRRASSHISKLVLPAKYPRQGLGTSEHQVLASFQSEGHVSPDRASTGTLLEARPFLCCAAGYLGIDIYPESAVFLPAFQVPYHHFTIWHTHSTAWRRYRCCTEDFFLTTAQKCRYLWQRAIF